MSTSPVVRRVVCFAVMLALSGCHAQSASPDKWTTVDASADHGDSGPVTFAGAWDHLGRRTENGTAGGSRSSHAGDEVAFHFTGTQIRLYGDIDPTDGYGVVLIDGAMMPDRIDFYSPTLRSHALVYTSPVLDSGGHTLIVQVSGVADGKGKDTYVDVDDAQFLAAK